jgi:predicted transposase/invertase (TIGR01784 family)
LKITDILYAVTILEKTGYIYLLIEHQSNPEVLMPFRLQQYIFSIMTQHLKQKTTKVLPLVMPMVFYHGKEKYPYSTDIFQLFGDHSNLAQELFLKPFQLIDLTIIPDETFGKMP